MISKTQVISHLKRPFRKEWGILLFLVTSSQAFAFQMTGEFLRLRRQGIDSTDILSQNGVVTLTSKDLIEDMNYQPGFRVRLEKQTTTNFGAELEYSRMPEWLVRKEYSGKGIISFPFDSIDYAPTFHAADQGRYETRSVYDNADFNFFYAKEMGEHDYFLVRPLFGVRYTQIRENFSANFVKDSDTGSYNIDTNNRMLGAGLGLHLLAKPHRFMEWEIIGKVAGGGNAAKQHTVLIDQTTTIVRNYHPHQVKPMFILEGGARVKLSFFEKFGFTCGYYAVQGFGAALASEQIDLADSATSGSGLNVTGKPTIHGFSVGGYINF